MGRAGVLIVAVIAGLLALDPESSVLELVGFAWAGFGAAFGPVILLALFWKRFTAMGALAAMVVGAVVVAIWGNVSDEVWEGFALYEIVPGFVLALIAGVLVSLATFRHQPVVEQEFDEAAAIASGQEPTATV